eukprot:scaffold7831_cov108-Isochrysis_galbana.AAC.2
MGEGRGSDRTAIGQCASAVAPLVGDLEKGAPKGKQKPPPTRLVSITHDRLERRHRIGKGPRWEDHEQELRPSGQRATEQAHLLRLLCQDLFLDARKRHSGQDSRLALATAPLGFLGLLPRLPARPLWPSPAGRGRRPVRGARCLVGRGLLHLGQDEHLAQIEAAPLDRVLLVGGGPVHVEGERLDGMRHERDWHVDHPFGEQQADWRRLGRQERLHPGRDLRSVHSLVQQLDEPSHRRVAGVPLEGEGRDEAEELAVGLGAGGERGGGQAQWRAGRVRHRTRLGGSVACGILVHSA